MKLKATRSFTTRGFTLVELMVVVGIITTLLGILLPAIMSGVESARVARCQANMRQLATSVLTYAATNRGKYPPNYSTPAPGRYWCNKLIGGSEFGESGRTTVTKVGGGVMACPSDDNAARSYAMNIWASSLVDASVLKAAPAGFGLWASSDSADSSRMILLMESWATTGSEGTGWYAAEAVGVRGTTAGQRFGGDGGIVWNTVRFGTLNSELNFSRHRGRRGGGEATQAIGRTNIAYQDGHVAMRSDVDLVDALGKSTGDSVWCVGEKR